MKPLVFFSLILILALSAFPQNKLSSSDYLNLALSFKETGEYERAIGVLENALKKSTDEKIKKLLGKLYYLNAKPTKSLKIFKELKAKGWQEFLYLGLIYEDLGKLDDACRSYLESVRLKQNSISLYRLGKIFYKSKNFAKAKDFFLKLIAFDSSARLAHYYLGDCLLNTGDYEKSHYYLSKAMNFYPQNKKIKEKISLAKIKLGEDFFAKKAKEIEKRREMARFIPYRKEAAPPLVRVAIAKNLGKFTFRCSGNFIISCEKNIFPGKANHFYTLTLRNNEFILSDYAKDRIYAKFKGKLKIVSSLEEKGIHPFYILDLIYGEGQFWRKQIDRAYRGDLEVAAESQKLTLINTLNIEEYLYGVLPAEIPTSSPDEALKAQAVAARTIALRSQGRHKNEGFDFCSDVHCQVYQGLSVENEKTTAAVKETEGEVLFYNHQPIEAFYHANCGGCLRSDAFGKNDYLVEKFDSPLPAKDNLPRPEGQDIPSKFSLDQEEQWFYLLPQSFCSGSDRSNFRWQRVYDAEDFLLAFGFELKDLKAILAQSKGDCFHCDAISVVTSGGRTTLKGDLKIRDYFDNLRSSAFKVEMKLSKNNLAEMLFFWGAGFGHGAGLCQEGAVTMAKEGYNYREILKHYYPHASLEQSTVSLQRGDGTN